MIKRLGRTRSTNDRKRNAYKIFSWKIPKERETHDTWKDDLKINLRRTLQCKVISALANLNTVLVSPTLTLTLVTSVFIYSLHIDRSCDGVTHPSNKSCQTSKRSIASKVNPELRNDFKRKCKAAN